MEGKTRKARKLALLIASCMAALLFNIGQPHKASAQFINPQVSANGVGDLLIFSYWTTSGRETLIAIGNAFGGQARRFAHVRFRERVASGSVRNFTICLSPGDVWTASLTSATATTSTLRVGNPGSCDADVLSFTFTPPPLPGVPVSIGAIEGYIEAFTMEAGGGDDTIWGVATPVNTSAGFSSSYNATALINFNAPFNESPTVFSSGAVSAALAREGGVDKEILFARYVAGDIFAATTQIVLTFPAGFQPGADPVSAFFFDEEERFAFSPRQVTLPWEVNVCTIEQVSGVTRISCPTTSFDVSGATPAKPPCPAGTFCAGWVRIINNTVGADSDDIETLPATRFPVIGLVFSSFSSTAGRFDQSFPIQWAAVRGAGGLGGVLSFSIASTFAPWFSSGGLLITPGDSTTIALNRTGTSKP